MKPVPTRLLSFLTFAVFAAAVAWASTRLGWAELGAAAAGADPAYGLAAVLLNAAILPAWALQWQLLARAHAAVPARRMAEVVALTWTAQKTLLPVFALPVAGVLLVARARLSAPGAVALLTLDQGLVAVVKLLLLLAALALTAVPAWPGGLALPEAAGVAVLVCGGLFFGVVVGRRVSIRSVPFLGALVEALITTATPSRIMGAAGLALLKKALEILAILAVQRACGLHLPLESAVLVAAALAATTMVPATPGHIGIYEGTVALVYAGLGVPLPVAVAAGVLQHAALLLPAVAFGSLVLLKRQFGPRRLSLRASS